MLLSARKIGGTTIRSISDISKHQRLKDNDVEFVAPLDMLVELRGDNQRLHRQLRSTRELRERCDDVATASLIEKNWIDESERPYLVPFRDRWLTHLRK
jgi:starvation-inducible DNA-binding protein